jgi:hypothetical protein
LEDPGLITTGTRKFPIGSEKVTAEAIPSFLVGCPSLAKLMPSQASETKVKDL